MHNEFSLDRFAEWLSATIPKMHTMQESKFKLPITSSRINKRMELEFKSRTSELVNAPD